jgi:hypothetical protein
MSITISTFQELLDFILDSNLNTKQTQELLNNCEIKVIFLDDSLSSQDIVDQLEKWTEFKGERPLFLPLTDLGTEPEFDIKRDYNKVLAFKD